MDELLRDFLTETGESLDRVDAQLVRLEREPPGDDAGLIAQLGRIAAQAHETHDAHPQQNGGSASNEGPLAQTSPEAVDSANTERLPGEIQGNLASQSIRVSIDTLDQLM